jgi:hypothetical protein
MTRRASRITKVEVERLIAAVQARGLSVARVTFDGDRVDVVISDSDKAPSARSPKPDRFESWEEYDAWRAQQPARTPVGTDRTFQSLEEYEAWRLKHHGF